MTDFACNGCGELNPLHWLCEDCGLCIEACCDCDDHYEENYEYPEDEDETPYPILQ